MNSIRVCTRVSYIEKRLNRISTTASPPHRSSPQSSTLPFHLSAKVDRLLSALPRRRIRRSHRHHSHHAPDRPGAASENYPIHYAISTTLVAYKAIRSTIPALRCQVRRPGVCQSTHISTVTERTTTIAHQFSEVLVVPFQ